MLFRANAKKETGKTYDKQATMGRRKFGRGEASDARTEKSYQDGEPRGIFRLESMSWNMYYTSSVTSKEALVPSGALSPAPRERHYKEKPPRTTQPGARTEY